MDPGSSLGPYRIDRELGSGGMGKVYAATGPDGVVALKIVHPHLLEQPGFFKRFLREADIGKSVRHDNVVRTLDCDQLVSGGQANAFLVMEYVEGQTLAELQRELDRVPEELCRHVAREICKGLVAIHDAGVVHRDLKPENVLITPDHVVKVMDLGVARLADEQMRLSQSGAFIGSVEYAAPEQFGGEVDHRCDLHSLGVLLYEIAAGQHPYRADTFPAAMKSIREDAPRRLGEVHPQLSPFLEEVVHTLLAKDREERFGSAGELLSILQAGEDSPWWHKRASTIRAATKRPLRRIRIPRETAVYGRDAELAKLRALFEQAKAGDGQVVLVEGEAGIGKSRLIDELIGRLQADGEDLNFLFGSYPPGGAATASGALSTAFREHFGDAGSADYLTQTPLLVPAFDAVLHGQPPPPGEQALTKESLGTCFVNASRALAAERTTVVLVDDLHFAPEDGRALFTTLALAAPDHRILLVGTMRPGVPGEWRAHLTHLDPVSQMELHRLGPKDLVELLRDSFRSEQLAEKLGVQIALKSDGNPFFAFEIVRGLREGQFITQRDDGSWVSSRVIEDIAIPSSVLDLVKARVADLTDEEKDLLEIAACCGYEFDPSLVAEVAGVPVVAALRRLGRIEAKHRLVRAAGRNLVFDHHQVQEALYQGILEQLREHYHGAIADALVERSGAHKVDPAALDGALCVSLCEHLFDAARPESALRYLQVATTYLEQGQLHAHAGVLLSRALDSPGLIDGEQRVRVLVRRAELPSGAISVASPLLDEALAIAQRLANDDRNPRPLALVQLSRGNYLTGVGEYDLARECLTWALDRAQVAGDMAGEADVCGAFGWLANRQGRYDEARSLFERQLELGRLLGIRRLEGHATSRLGTVFYNIGELDAAWESLERGLTILEEVGDRAGQGATIGNLGNVMSAMGHYERAIALRERAQRISRSVGSRRSASISTGNLGLDSLHLGWLTRAMDLFEEALAVSREIDHRLFVGVALQYRGSLLTSLGAPETGHDPLVEGYELCRNIGMPKHEGDGLMRLGIHFEQLGDLPEAERWLREAVRVLRKANHRPYLASALAARGRALLSSGSVDDARSCLAEAETMAVEVGSPRARVRAACLLACIPDGDVAHALELTRQFENRLDQETRIEAHYLLWGLTSDAVHLEVAHSALQHLRDHAPAEYRDTMIENVPLHRDIVAAWREEFGEEDDSTGDGSPTEFPTHTE